MYRDKRVIALVPAYNEAAKIGRVVARTDGTPLDAVLVIDDGSTDETADVARSHGAEVLSLDATLGVGAALRAGMDHARSKGFDIVVCMAGNNKDDPKEIVRLLDPICDDDADFVIGSRFLPGGGYGGDMPLYRKIATRVHPRLMSWFVRKRLTESTNGFRAFKIDLLDDDRIDLRQRWLDGYALEIYLLMRVIQLGYRHREIPCTKVYPPRRIGNTKMTPIIGWWGMLQPIFRTGLAARR